MVVFLGIRPGQVPEEPQPEGLDPFRDWQAACSVPKRLICSVSGVWCTRSEGFSADTRCRRHQTSYRPVIYLHPLGDGHPLRVYIPCKISTPLVLASPMGQRMFLLRGPSFLLDADSITSVLINT